MRDLGLVLQNLPRNMVTFDFDICLNKLGDFQQNLNYLWHGMTHLPTNLKHLYLDF